MMNKTIRSAFLLLAGILLAGAGCACSVSTQTIEPTFEKAGMSIVLTDAFYEKDLVSQTAYYESSNAIVTALKDEFSTLEAAGIGTDISLSDYAGIVMEVNGLDSEIREEDGLTYFTYEKSVSGKDYQYFASVYQAPDAFWLIQFGCERDNFEELEPDFIKWAGTVTFE